MMHRKLDYISFLEHFFIIGLFWFYFQIILHLQKFRENVEVIALNLLLCMLRKFRVDFRENIASFIKFYYFSSKIS